MDKKYNDFAFMQWYYDFSTKKKLIVLTIITTIAMIAIGFTGFYFNQKASTSIDIIYNNNLQPIRWINLSRIHMNASRTNIYGAIANMGYSDSNIKKQLNSIVDRDKKFDENIAKVDEQMQKLNDTKSLNEIKKLEETWSRYKKGRVSVIKQIKSGDKEAALKKAIGMASLTTEVIDSISTVATHIQKRAEKRHIQSIKDAKTSVTIMISVILLAIGLSLFLSLLAAGRINGILGELIEKMHLMAEGDLTIENIEKPENSDIGDLCVVFDKMLLNMKNLVIEVATSSNEVASSTQEMSASSEQAAQGAQQVAQSVEELATGTEEMSNNIAQSVENLNKVHSAIQVISESAQNTVKISTSTEQTAAEGKKQADDAIVKINQIKITSTGVSETINELGTLSSEIESIVDLIKTIANQTNLLALNAAIEAARAGEHGKGFAVVADEVKKLAGESAEATDKITKMIKEIQNKTNFAVISMNESVQEVGDGVVIIENTGKSLEEILNAAKITSKEITGIADEVNVVSTNANNVVTMMENVSAITEESSASAEEISSISEEQSASSEEISAGSQALAKIAEGLQEQISKFRV